MASIKQYAKEVFREINKSKSKNAYTNFIKELERLHKEQQLVELENDVGCAMSNNCSFHGCYRYYCCDFPKKKVT